MQREDSAAAGDSHSSVEEYVKRPYQAPKLGRIDLEADRVLGFCHGGNTNESFGGCEWLGSCAASS